MSGVKKRSDAKPGASAWEPDERAAACVAACKAYRHRWPIREHNLYDESFAIWDAGAAYDAPSEPTLVERDVAKLFGMDVVAVSGQSPPMLVVPCVDGSMWVSVLGGEPKHLDRDAVAKIAMDAMSSLYSERAKARP